MIRRAFNAALADPPMLDDAPIPLRLLAVARALIGSEPLADSTFDFRLTEPRSAERAENTYRRMIRLRGK